MSKLLAAVVASTVVIPMLGYAALVLVSDTKPDTGV